MNERIRELAVKSGIAYQSKQQDHDTNDGFTVISSKDSLEKFAELIVKECMRMCEVTEMSFVTHDCDVEASGASTVKQFIAEHFGFEE